jgi:hypothetical protein
VPLIVIPFRVIIDRDLKGYTFNAPIYVYGAVAVTNLILTLALKNNYIGVSISLSIVLVVLNILATCWVYWGDEWKTINVGFKNLISLTLLVFVPIITILCNIPAGVGALWYGSISFGVAFAYNVSILMDEYDSNYVKIPVILVYVALSFLFAFTIPNAQFIMMILGVELLITYGVLNEEGIVDTAEDWWIIAIGIAMILLGFVTTVLSCVKG